MKKAAKVLLWVGILAALETPAFAETRTISWNPVTTYTDSTPIEAGKTIGYSAYWTTDPGLGTLRTIGTSLTTTSTTFDPTVQGMTRGGTVYFTAKAVLNTGEESALSPAYAWVVPLVTPPPAAVLTSIAVSGPSSVNEGATGTYTATGTWDNGTTAAVTPTWSENSTYATIGAGGLLTASAVTANQPVTVTATYGGRTGTMSVTIANVAATLTSIAVSGASSVNEGATGTYTATGTWDNGTTAAISPTWSENSTYATIGTGGLLTASAVTSNQPVTVTATYGGRTGTMSVTIVNVAATLTGIAVSGPSSVNEGATGTYTTTATWSDGTNTTVTPTWSANLGTISGTGLFTAPSVTANQSATIGASYTSGVTRTASVGVTVVNGTATLTGIAVSGPSSVNEGGTGTYTATGTWDNGTTAAISPTWSENSTYATIGTGGLLTASAVTSNQPATVTATYGGRTGTMSLTIVDVAGAAPAAPRNIGIADPIASVSTPSVSAPSVSTEIWRINWDSVTTTWDGTPIDPVRTVRYTAYWTDNPALSAGSLRTLASSISGTTLDFDPSANQMTKNQVVYLTVRATLDTGEQSSLATSLTWRVENAGPVPPAKGRIVKK